MGWRYNFTVIRKHKQVSKRTLERRVRRALARTNRTIRARYGKDDYLVLDQNDDVVTDHAMLMELAHELEVIKPNEKLKG
jgi:predicted amidophosphoribosyltransferase